MHKFILLPFLLPIWLSCSNKPANPRDKVAKPAQPAAAQPAAAVTKSDTIAQEPQTVHFNKIRKDVFPDTTALKAISYSFLDVHDYELDSTNRGQLLTIMPGYDQYLSRTDPHPKVILSKEQTRKLLSIINDPANYSRTAAFCYNPRNCFIFYDSKNEIVGWYEVCFECARIQSIPAFKISRRGGLTDKGLNKLKQFCISSNISVGQP